MIRHLFAILALSLIATGSQAQIYDPRTWTNIYVTRLPDEIHSREIELPCSFSPDGVTLYFSSKRKGPDQVWSCKYDLLSFSEPQAIHEFNKLATGAITIDAAGETFLAMRNPDASSATPNDINIYQIDYKLGKLEALPTSINTESWESQPFITKDGQTLFYAAVPIPGKNNDKPDIFFSRKEHGIWQYGKSAGPIVNTKDYEGFPTLSPDGRFLFFTRISGLKRALYWCERLDNAWSEPIELPEPINSGREMAVVFHPTERMFLIASARVSKIRKADYDIYVVRYDLKE
jgi:hypothetical protein